MRPPALLLALIVAASTAAQEGVRRPMTSDDGLNLVTVGSALLHPDGSWVLYSKSELDWKGNKRKTTWWRVGAEGGDSYPYIGEDGGSGFSFSPDGSRLAFTRPVDGKTQIFLLRTGGGEAQKLTDHKTAVSRFQRTPEGGAMLFGGLHGTDTNLCRLDVASGSVSQVTHGFREPRHLRTRDVEEIRWIQEHVRRIQWTPWERPAEEKKDQPKVVSQKRPAPRRPSCSSYP